MRLALISPEFDGGVHVGGIGTYMRNVADMMTARGHEVEVFAAGADTATEIRDRRLRINTVRCHARGDYPDLIAPAFLERHRKAPFDVAEGAEFLAETRVVAAAAPDLPLVLKLHTPGALISIIESQVLPISAMARFVLGGLRRGKIVRPYWRYNPASDYERANLQSASEVTAPCHAIAQKLSEIWGIDPADVAVIPNVFVAPKALLNVPVDTQTNVITCIGRLEVRKGVTDLANAIPLVLRRFKAARFRFVGRSLPYPGTGQDMREMLMRQLAPVSHAVEFLDGVPYDQVHRYYAASDICVVPSVWENFPNVCLEAMSAARGVVGSSAGGMAEMIDDGRTGLLVPPRNSKAIADAILTLLREPERRKAIGRAAREHVKSAYAPDVVAPMQEASYERAITRARRGEASDRDAARHNVATA
jgi:glycosyltransferase involved in cell wall biosynthesis